MNTTSDDTFAAAAAYANLGWRVLPTYGLAADGKTCTCRSGENCGTPGKHPKEWAWQESATTDEDKIEEWFVGTNSNVSVALGEESNVVDIEWDGPEGKETAEKFGVVRAETPTYQSHRSEHRIFRYDPRLPQQAVIKVGGLEVRIGGGSRGAQSVFPPSLHASGVRYRWKYGYSPDDVDVAEIPPAFMQEILRVGNREEAREPATAYLHKDIGDGERHNVMCRLIAGVLIKMLDPHDPREQQDTLAVCRSINLTQCKPPLEDAEVESIWRGELRWAIKVRSIGGGPEFLKEKLESHISGNEADQEDASARDDMNFTLSGLEYRDGEWWPGQWRLKVVHSDPVSYVLTVPSFSANGEDRFIDVVLNAEQYRSASKVAHAVLEATHTVILDEIPETWATIWAGRAGKRGQPAIRGLKAKLMDGARSEESSAEAMRFARVAEWFLGAITTVPAPKAGDDPGAPSPSGHPSWVQGPDGEWELWFGWQTAWEAADRGRRKILEGDQSGLKRRVLAITGEEDFPTGRHTGDGGVRRRYIRWTDKHIRALERLAAGDTPAVTTSPAILPPAELRRGIAEAPAGGDLELVRE